MDSNVYAPPKATLELLTKPCSECAEAIHTQAVVCPKCGVRQKGIVSKTTLLLLTLLTGCLGGHKFYLKKPWQGTLYLLLCWTWLPLLASLVEFVIHASSSEATLNAKHKAVGPGLTVVITLVALSLLTFFACSIVSMTQLRTDYITRARVGLAIDAVQPMRQRIEQFATTQQRLPRITDNVLEQDYVELEGLGRARLLDDGVIQVFVDLESPRARFHLIPVLEGNRISWHCGGELLQRWRPGKCGNPPGESSAR